MKNQIKAFIRKVNVDPIESMERFRVTWKELSYTASALVGVKRILKEVNGYFETGQITAVMGPSGCGKSTLLGCLSGQKRKGVTGSISISTENNVNINSFTIITVFFKLSLNINRKTLYFINKVNYFSNQLGQVCIHSSRELHLGQSYCKGVHIICIKTKE